jgi:hypothetical protein
MSCTNLQYRFQDCASIAACKVGILVKNSIRTVAVNECQYLKLPRTSQTEVDLLKSGKAAPNRDLSTEFAASTEAAYIV